MTDKTNDPAHPGTGGEFGLAPRPGNCFFIGSSVRIWRNWQTRYFEVVVE